jgi:uncharacterized alkaline shock family protein YloU
MMSEDEKSDLGLIKIHNNVIASVSYLAALEVEGVSRICDNLRSSFLNMIGKKTKSGAIDIRSEKTDSVSIIVPLIIKYGYNIPEVALKVQKKVKIAVEEATDLSPKEIIVKIKGVEK